MDLRLTGAPKIEKSFEDLHPSVYARALTLCKEVRMPVSVMRNANGFDLCIGEPAKGAEVVVHPS